jgi:hypothetical protein
VELEGAASHSGDQSPVLGILGYLLASQGDRQRAQEILQQLTEASKQGYVSPLSVAMVSVGMGDKDEAFRQLRLAVAKHVLPVCQIGVDPVFDSLRADPRFAQIIREIGLPASN